MKVSGWLAVITVSVFFLILFTSGICMAAQSVVNGGFETGDFTGWTVVNGGASEFVVMSGTLIGHFTVLSPPAGTYAAMTLEESPGFSILYQDIAVPAGGSTNFSATIYLENFADTWVNGPGLSYTGGPNQQFRVDIMNPAAAVDDVGTGVLLNVFQTQPGDPLTLGYTQIQADLTPFTGQTVRIRFAEAVNEEELLAGVDQVSATTTFSVPTMNEWGMILFMLFAGFGSIYYMRRQKRVNI
jgi:hypothetical protein